MPLHEMTHCPQCGAPTGELHDEGCSVELCATTGDQRIGACSTITGCHADPRIDCRTAWTGLYPGAAECRAFGFYASGPPYAECSADDVGAMEDINRLRRECRWDPSTLRFVRPEPGGTSC